MPEFFLLIKDREIMLQLICFTGNPQTASLSLDPSGTYFVLGASGSIRLPQVECFFARQCVSLFCTKLKTKHLLSTTRSSPLTLLLEVPLRFYDLL
jgi:hypothetical protein